MNFSVVDQFLQQKKTSDFFMNLTYSVYSFAGLQVVFTALLNDSNLCVSEKSDVESLSKHPDFLKTNHISCTPSFFRALMIQAEKMPELKYITFGGERVDQKILDDVKNLFPKAHIAHIYASTEAGSLFSVKDGKEGFPEDWLKSKKGDVELKVRSGNLWIKSPNMMQGYIGRGASKLDKGAWIDTQDMVEISKGRVLFKGRRNITINIGGQKVSPEYVESKLLDCKECIDCRVFPFSNPLLGALVAAEVVLERPEKENLEKLKVKIKKVLTKFEMPVKFNVVEKISLGDSNKKTRV